MMKYTGDHKGCTRIEKYGFTGIVLYLYLKTLKIDDMISNAKDLTTKHDLHSTMHTLEWLELIYFDCSSQENNVTHLYPDFSDCRPLQFRIL